MAGGPFIGFLSDRYGKTLNWIYKACLYSSFAFMILAAFSDQGVVILGIRMRRYFYILKLEALHWKPVN